MKNKEQIRTALLALADSGKLTPDEVVRLARSPDHPLHELFEWNDSEAAKKYRLDQAREIISSFDVTIKIDRVTLDVQQFVRDPEREADEQGYVQITSIETESDAAIEIVTRELGIAKSYVDRTERFAQLLGLQKDTRALSDRLSEIADSLTKKKRK